MGLLISRFRRKRTTHEVLDELEKKIRTIEQYGYSTEQQRRRVIGMLMVISIGLYVLAVIIYYFYFRVKSWREGLLYATPLLISPVVVILLRAILTWYYGWKIERNKTHLVDMRAEKKRILEEVMDTETYKYAKEILDKFGDGKENVTDFRVMDTSFKSTSPTSNVLATPQQLRQRQVVLREKNDFSNSSNLPNLKNINLSNTPISARPLTPLNSPNLPRPILSHGSAFDRLVDYLIGDGPGSRYALICAKCSGHNGMALPEEFEFLSYRCAHCRHLNPARKQKPKPPPLISTPVHIKYPPIENDNDGSETSDEEKNSNKDSDEEAIPVRIKPDPDKPEDDSIERNTTVSEEESDKTDK